MKKDKNNYDPEIETVKYLGLVDLNKFWLILTLPQKYANLLDMHLVIQFYFFSQNFISQIWEKLLSY